MEVILRQNDKTEFKSKIDGKYQEYPNIITSYEGSYIEHLYKHIGDGIYEEMIEGQDYAITTYT